MSPRRTISTTARRWVVVFSVTLCLAAGMTHANAESATPALWRVSGGGNEGYLFGSIHLARADIYPLAEGIYEAFGRSNLLAVEVDIDSKQYKRENAQFMQSWGFNPRGRSLSKQAGPARWQTIERACEAVVVVGAAHLAGRHSVALGLGALGASSVCAIEKML